MENWHDMAIEEVLLLNGASLDGLSKDEAKRRLLRTGPNVLPEGKRRNPLGIFIDQFKNFLILILIIAAIISGLVGDAKDTLVIIVVLIINAAIGFGQEYRAQRAMEALKKLSSPTALVKRDGNLFVIPASDLVPGDIVHLREGDVVPADIRLIETANLHISEAVLTGESEAVIKGIKSDVSISFRGTQVVKGRGVGVVVATGHLTELGKIATMLETTEVTKTPLQKRLVSFGFKLGIATIVICSIIFVAGLLRGEGLVLMLLTAISLAVAAVPEALPIVVTISLAFGARRMAKHKSLVRKLAAVETLGSVTFICSDKTGTMTENRMTVEVFFVGGKLSHLSSSPEEFQKYLLLASALCNDATKSGGEPTEMALYNAAAELGYRSEDLLNSWKRIDEIPFDSERKMMTTLHKSISGEYFSFVKGAAELLIDRCVNSLDGVFDRNYIDERISQLASEGKRIIALAYHRGEELREEALTFLGLASIYDPPRDEVRQAVEECRAAGIVPVMITGDHPRAALAIAREVGIACEDDQVITGEELERIPLELLEENVSRYRVYARVAPHQKLKIIQALQDKGEFVAMTGDGVNDAPALKKADIGVGMGLVGTEVAKEASDMILTDDNFSTIVHAVREGRQIYDNILKFIKFALGSNSGELWTIFLAPFLGLPLPLFPIQILWINLVTDSLPGLALTKEGEEEGLMRRPPRHPRESIFAHGLGIHVIWVGLLMAIVSLSVEWFGFSEGGDFKTMVFTVLCLSKMGHVLAIRSGRISLFKQGLFTNLPLLGAVTLTIILQLAIIYIPSLQPIFKTQALSLIELAICLLASTSIFWAVEVEKWLKRKFNLFP